MPVLTASQLTQWRSHPQRRIGYLAVWQPALVLKRRINQSTFAYPVSLLAFDDPDSNGGSTSDVEAGMTIKFYDGSTGAFKGYGRVLRAISGSYLYIHPTGQGDVDFADNDIIEIYDEFRPYALIPYIDSNGTLYKDYDTTFSGQTEDFPPVANANPSTNAGYVDGTTGKLTVTFDAAGDIPSYALANGATISSYSWDVKDGTIVSGSSTSAAITVEFPAGRRWVKLTVTDSNGATAVKRVPIWAADDGDYAPYKAVLSRRGYTHDTGWEASFTLMDADLSDVPEHALIIFWQDEWFGPTSGSIGSPTAFVGWLVDEMLHLEPLWSDSAFSASGPLAILQQRPAFPQTVSSDTTPANWAEVKDLDWWKTVVYLLRWHSNMLELCDFERPNFYSDYPVPRLDAELGTLYSQIKFLADAVFARFTADRRGRLYLRRVPHYMSSSERSAWTPILELTDADLATDGQGPEFEWAHWDKIAWLRSSAIVADASTSTPVLAIAPGKTPAQGADVQTLDRLLVTSQDDLNERTGHVYAYRQSRRDGKRVARRATLTLAHGGDVIDPALQEVVTLTLSSSTNRRGYSWSSARFVPAAIDVMYNHDAFVSLERLTLEEETRGAAAATEEIPTDTVNDYDPPAYVQPPTVDPTTPESDWGSGLKSAIVAVAVELRSTSSVYASVVATTSSLTSPSWSLLMTGLPDDGYGGPEYITSVTTNPFNQDEALLACSGGVYRNTDWRGGGTWSQIVSMSDILSAWNTYQGRSDTVTPYIVDMHLSMNEEGCIFLLCTNPISGAFGENLVFPVRILNYGTTVEAKASFLIKTTGGVRIDRVTRGAPNVLDHGGCGIQSAHDTRDDIVVAAAGTMPTWGGQIGWWSGDFDSVPLSETYLGVKYAYMSYLDQPTTTLTAAIPYIPYTPSEPSVARDDEVFILAIDGKIYRSTNGGSTFSAWSGSGQYPRVWDHSYNPSRDTFTTAMLNAGYAAYLLDDGTDRNLYIDTDNTPTTWTAKATPTTGHWGWLGGFPDKTSQFYIGHAARVDYWGRQTASNPLLYLTTNGGDTWTDITGNLWSLLPTAAGRTQYAGIVRMTPHGKEA